jgi:hypothetical protein
MAVEFDRGLPVRFSREAGVTGRPRGHLKINAILGL